MQYEDWRDDIFGKPEGYDPIVGNILEETANLPEIQTLDFIDRALQDPEIHTQYSVEQIGIGLNIIFNIPCSNISRCYAVLNGNVENEQRKIESIKCLRNLYSNFFARYCISPVRQIGESLEPKQIGFICSMLWDIFVLCPGNATPAMVEATIEMMADCLKTKNDNCLESLIHGLGHWIFDSDRANSDRAKQVLDDWLKLPTTDNQVIIDYATYAKTGYIQ
ncbi:MAG: hypothetical protein F6J87_10240 [Spirulina sp. SIO3F2]|nr:hypothetical protein [Spirulina sp. SIO3F2]